ncbi:hypothetical protein KY290_025002 [Solanum tuberosum]|uniref:Uncharacterized protein n=1 Tax=Solanum tuberosum TaxID=4113 RepID=A0ABQ7UUA0_SOLTU|nr:hypothetical protein KY284_023857 [Solanum tuberosum]KAH0754732.1 hypothetical protein KY290_025002 [Solanum tuberosum]
MPQMVDKDKGKSKKFANPTKKFKANAMRRPTGVVISDEPSRVNISKRALISTTHSAHQSHNASSHVAPQSSYTISTPTVVPSSGYQTLQGYSHLGRGSTIPSASASQCNSLNTSSGSIGLSNVHLESNGSEPNTPTTQHSDAHSPQSGDRDNFRRLVIEPLGYNLRLDVGMAKIILKCIGTHYNSVYLNWSSIPLNTQGQMFNEFKEKELGRPVAVAEMFKVTHAKKSTNPTEEERWIEPRAQETYDRPFTQEENENLWKQSAGEPIRGLVYGYPEKVYQKKKFWYCGSSSSSFDGGDRETISAMESKIAYLNAEHDVVAEIEKKREEREKKREEEIAAAKEVENKRYAALQAQLTFLFESKNILPPCPASSDRSDQEGDENDKSDKESEGDDNGKSDKESEGDEE